MEYFNTNWRLSRADASARYVILNQYKKLGETKASIEKIQDEVNTLAGSRYDITSILPDFLQQLNQVEVERKHKVIRLNQHNNFKVALHIIPSRYEIPAHLHLGVISIINVQYGALRIKQRSIFERDKAFYSEINKHQACAGLEKLRNIHSIHSKSSPCIFLSFRISKKQSVKDKIKKQLPVLASTLMLMFSGFFNSNIIALEKSPVGFSDHFLHYVNNSNVVLANKLRTGIGVEKDLQAAALLYLQEAKKGNAEAQYWIGVMCFDGEGITEDTDEALQWIALSSNQNYPPAQKLLRYMLSVDEVLDC